ncbi:transcription factor KUA1 [Telopea speciosissima]|uniref:transcription factor KUA1 n=1 Tax=Telopea speciosissima TaxID=54955 RepID=UPI001CC547CF|nr:transcription factor KUA1 [Telopea speciosissima]
MTRRCSHCSNNGHNSRTCPNRGVKLFGVRLTDGSIRKSASMGNLTHYTGSNGNNHHNTGTNPSSPGETPEHGAAADGYASEDFVPGSSSSRERKKGVPWTEEEHRMFLLGLQKLGKGDWRGIARNYVVSRTPTQVASHAQKYFIRQSNMSRRKRRSSLFDIIADESADTLPSASQELYPISNSQAENQSNNLLPAPPAVEEECESMDSTNSNDGEVTIPKAESSQCSYPVVFPTYFSPFFPFSFPFWPGYSAEGATKETHEVVKPTAVHSKNPINFDELVGMSKLSLGESLGHSGPSSLSLKLLEGSTRQSAFHPKPTSGGSDMDTSSNPIHAV